MTHTATPSRRLLVRFCMVARKAISALMITGAFTIFGLPWTQASDFGRPWRDLPQRIMHSAGCTAPSAMRTEAPPTAARRDDRRSNDVWL